MSALNAEAWDFVRNAGADPSRSSEVGTAHGFRARHAAECSAASGDCAADITTASSHAAEGRAAFGSATVGSSSHAGPRPEPYAARKERAAWPTLMTPATSAADKACEIIAPSSLPR